MLFEAEEDASHLYIAALAGCLGEEEEEQKKHYHAKLLCDAGFFCSINKEGLYRITNQGHDYIDAIRDDGIWQKTKKAVAETGGSATLEIIKSVAMAFAKEEIRKHTGLDI